MMASTKQWIVLFGGAGREASIERMLMEGHDVKVVVVPARRNAKLEKAVDKLKTLPCELLEVERIELVDFLKSFAGKALLSIGFPYLIPGEVLELFQPALNVHPTLLPRYRGPTTAAYILINNERESGSTVHYMTAEMDRGDVVAQSRVELSGFETVRSLQRKVYASEPQLVVDAVAAISAGIKSWPQDESCATEFPKKRTPVDSEIDPSRPLSELFDQIRSCDPEDFPAFFIHKGQKVCIRLWRPEKFRDEADQI
jgi:methionyl-tRNA formyltransferase